MDQSIELFEFAQQIATPEYVAMKTQSMQNIIDGSTFAIIICLCAIGSAIALALIGFALDRKTKIDGGVLYTIAFAIVVISSIALFFTTLACCSSIGQLTEWQNDPATHIAGELMKVIA